MSVSDKKLPENIRAALIDMDGVLYDSMPGHAHAWQKMMAEHGLSTTPEEFYLYEGMTGSAVIDKVIRREMSRPATEAEKEEMYRRKSEIFKSEGRKKPMPGAQRMVAAMIAAGLPRVLVTGSGQGSLLDALNEDYPGGFAPDRRVTAFDVKHGKPNPEPYLIGARKAGVDPADAMVVENAPLGVRAGKAAGCFTVAVTTGPIPRKAFEDEGADLIFDSMPQFAEWLETALQPL